MALSLSRQYSDSSALSWFSFVVMSASNLGGAALAVWYALHFRHGSPIGRWTLTIIGIVLMAMRQDTELRRWYEVHVLKKPAKERTA